MSKLIKTLLAFAAVGTATAAGVAYYLKKTENDDDFLDEFEDESGEFAESVDDREYVSLNPTADADEEASAETVELNEEPKAEDAEVEVEEAAEEAEETEEVAEETEAKETEKAAEETEA